jgi:hypothetical protein
MRVGVSFGGGADAGVETDEDAEEVGFEDVDEFVEVCVFGGRGVAGGGAGFLAWRTGGGAVCSSLEER